MSNAEGKNHLEEIKSDLKKLQELKPPERPTLGPSPILRPAYNILELVRDKVGGLEDIHKKIFPGLPVDDFLNILENEDIPSEAKHPLTLALSSATVNSEQAERILKLLFKASRKKDKDVWESGLFRTCGIIKIKSKEAFEPHKGDIERIIGTEAKKIKEKIAENEALVTNYMEDMKKLEEKLDKIRDKQRKLKSDNEGLKKDHERLSYVLD